MGTHPVFQTRDDLLNPRETSQSTQRASGSDQAGLRFCRHLSAFCADLLGTSFDVCPHWDQKDTSVQHLAVAADRNRCPDGRNDFADSGLTLGTQPPPPELSGQVDELAAELGVGWTGASYLLPVRQSSPRQESVEPVCVNKDRVPLRRSGAPAKKRRGTETCPAGAVDLLRMRVAAPRRRGASPQDSEVAMKNGHREMLGLLARRPLWRRQRRDDAACVSIAAITAAASVL